jgi:hypothetical protein
MISPSLCSARSEDSSARDRSRPETPKSQKMVQIVAHEFPANLLSLLDKDHLALRAGSIFERMRMDNGMYLCMSCFKVSIQVLTIRRIEPKGFAIRQNIYRCSRRVRVPFVALTRLPSRQNYACIIVLRDHLIHVRGCNVGSRCICYRGHAVLPSPKQ